MTKHIIFFSLLLTLSLVGADIDENVNDGILDRFSSGPQDLQKALLASCMQANQMPLKAGAQLRRLRGVDKKWKAIVDREQEYLIQMLQKQHGIKHAVVARAALQGFAKLIPHLKSISPQHCKLADRQSILNAMLAHLVVPSGKPLSIKSIRIDNTCPLSKNIVEKIIRALGSSTWLATSAKPVKFEAAGIQLMPHYRTDVIALQDYERAGEYAMDGGIRLEQIGDEDEANGIRTGRITHKILCSQTDKIIYASLVKTQDYNSSQWGHIIVSRFNADRTLDKTFGKEGIRVLAGFVGCSAYSYWSLPVPPRMLAMSIAPSNDIVLSHFSWPSVRIWHVSSDGKRCESIAKVSFKKNKEKDFNATR